MQSAAGTTCIPAILEAETEELPGYPSETISVCQFDYRDFSNLAGWMKTEGYERLRRYATIQEEDRCAFTFVEKEDASTKAYQQAQGNQRQQ